ncbi:MAG: DUF4124 domain-containing protein [Gammaproteobacteria bacterium]|nr:DUF4124 domain-containing protein [Gammaproteobacteria bacterium]
MNATGKMNISNRIITRTCRARTLVILGVALYVAQPVYGEAIYKSTDASGRVTYSADPAPDAVTTETIDIETLSPEERRAAALLRAQKGASLDASIAQREEAWKTADREVLQAQNALAQAEHALQTGRTPQAGERTGIVGRGSRLNDSYFSRIRSLETAVRTAKKRLDRAYRTRNGLR